MKFAYAKKVPKEVYLAFSGGSDSAALLHSLISKNKKVTLLCIDHNTEWCKKEIEFAIKVSNKLNINCLIYKIPEYDKSTSLECFWSKERNKIFQSMDKPVVTGHHLDDAVEWYIMSTFTGTVKVMDYQNQNVIRPLITTSKIKILEYIKVFNIEHLVDPTNINSDFNLRNKVRNELIPKTKEIFPGIEKVVKKLIIDKLNR